MDIILGGQEFKMYVTLMYDLICRRQRRFVGQYLQFSLVYICVCLKKIQNDFLLFLLFVFLFFFFKEFVGISFANLTRPHLSTRENLGV